MKFNDNRNSQIFKRLQRERRYLLNNQLEFFSIQWELNTIDKINLSLLGPDESLYEGGVFWINLIIPENYVFYPPKIIFKTPIFHPQIRRVGNHFEFVFLDYRDWCPALNISKLIIILHSELMNPKFDNICNLEMLDNKIYLKNSSLFEKKAREWTKKYAT